MNFQSPLLCTFHQSNSIFAGNILAEVREKNFLLNFSITYYENGDGAAGRGGFLRREGEKLGGLVEYCKRPQATPSHSVAHLTGWHATRRFLKLVRGTKGTHNPPRFGDSRHPRGAWHKANRCGSQGKGCRLGDPQLFAWTTPKWHPSHSVPIR